MLERWRFVVGMKSVFLAVSIAGSSAAMGLDQVSGAQSYEQVVAVPIPVEQASKTILGQDYRFPAGVPLIRAYTIDIPVGKQTSLHKHAIPLFAYVVSGNLEVDYGSKGKRTFKAGSAYIEAIEWCHIGRALGSKPVRLIGIYIGEQQPQRIAPEPCAKPD